MSDRRRPAMSAVGGGSSAPPVEFGVSPAPPAVFGKGLVLAAPAEVQEKPRAPRVPPARIKVRRRRLYAALAALLAVLLAAGVVVAITSGGSGGPPPDGTAALVPPDALGYVHLSLDPQRDANQQILQVARRLPDWPLISTVALSRLSSILSGGQSVDFGTAVRPWLGQEAALALLNTGGSQAGTLLLLDVAQPAAARSFLRSQGALPDGTYAGASELRYPNGTEVAFIAHYLALGRPDSVHAAIDSWQSGQTLASTPGFRAASAGTPSGTVLSAYLSAPGVRRLLLQRAGLAGLIGSLLDAPALQGVALDLSPSAAGADVRVHRSLDPALSGFGATQAQPPFSPTLTSLVPGSAMGMLDLKGLDHLLGRLLASGVAGGLQGRLGSLLAQLGTALTAEGINVSNLTSLFNAETVLALVPGSRGATGTRSTSLLLLTRTADEAATRAQLAELEAPLAQLFPPPNAGPGGAAVFNDVTVDGISAHQLILQPGLEFDYAVFHNLVAISTSLGGIAAVAHLGSPLAQDPAFQTTLGSRPAKVTSLLFLDFSQLLSLGERAGLAGGANLRTLQLDLQRIRAIGLTTEGGETDTTAELSLQIP